MQRSRQTLFKLVERFLQEEERNTWLYPAHIDLYVRKSRRELNGRQINCLDLANFSIRKPKKGRELIIQQTQLFELLDKLLTRLEQLHLADYPMPLTTGKIEAIWVENVSLQQLQEFFKERRGWMEVRDRSDRTWPPSYIYIQDRG